MRLLYLVDNSVIQRVHRSPVVADALGALLATGELASCLPQLLEECYSARSGAEYWTIRTANQRARIFLPPDDEVARLAIDLQARLFTSGMGRAVGISDLQIAATALRYTTSDQDVEIVHYDSDFDHLVRIEPALRARWIVRAGSIA